MEYLRYLAEWEGPMYVSLAGVTYPDASYEIRRQESKVWVMEYVKSGAGEVWIDGAFHRVEADTVYLLPRGRAHHYRADPDAPFEKIFMNLRGPFLDEIIFAYGLGKKHIFPHSSLGHIFEEIPRLLKEEKGEKSLQSALQGIFVSVLVRLSAFLEEEGYHPDALRMREYLDANLHRNVSGKELAQMIYRSPDYCLKRFKSQFHTTPGAYALDQKMKKAKALLADTSMSIGEISHALGYSDAHYFSNLFLQKCSMRPRAYRKLKKG